MEEENRRRGLDPRRMIRDVDELISRIAGNFDESGYLNVPKSNDEFKKKTMELKKKGKYVEPEFSIKKLLKPKNQKKMKNVLKVDKAEPMPMDAPMDYNQGS